MYSNIHSRYGYVFNRLAMLYPTLTPSIRVTGGSPLLDKRGIMGTLGVVVVIAVVVYMYMCFIKPRFPRFAF